jgi:serine protease Do
MGRMCVYRAKMNRSAVLWIVAAAILAPQATIAKLATPTPPTVVAPALEPGAEMRPFALTRLVANLPPGTAWSSPHAGLLCIASPNEIWRGGRQVINSAEYLETFRSEMKLAGFRVNGDGDNLFEDLHNTSDLQVGGVIKNINLDYCKQGANLNQAHGWAVMELEWQIYSSVQKTVLARIETKRRFEVKANDPGGRDSILIGAFKENIRALIADPAFRAMVIGVPIRAPKATRTTPPTIIPLSGALGAHPRQISDEVGSVVSVIAGNSLGSGFLVSTDGLLLSDYHVVGSARTVTIRWSDGIETPGEVIRSNRERDVALIRTLSRGRQPLPIRRDAMQSGDTVFAIGTPIREIFQNTVTRGVMSSYRTFNGLNFIQSDVVVNKGNSGGPLLDEKGYVVGISNSALVSYGIPIGLNLFCPVGDALDFLGAEPK